MALAVAVSQQAPAESEAADLIGVARRPRGAVPGPPWNPEVDAWYAMREALAAALDAR
jgi:hypothetical protein